MARLMLEPLLSNPDFGRFDRALIFDFSFSGSWNPSEILDSASAPKVTTEIFTDLRRLINPLKPKRFHPA